MTEPDWACPSAGKVAKLLGGGMKWKASGARQYVSPDFAQRKEERIKAIYW
jgi:hypothetical protein